MANWRAWSVNSLVRLSWCFGGRRKGCRGTGAAGKSVVFGLLSGMDGSITKGRQTCFGRYPHGPYSDHAPSKGSVYYTDAFRGYQSLRRYGKHHTVNHRKSLVDRRAKSHINEIEGFWSFAKHILYNYRGVSKNHFPMYLKEIEYR